MYIYYSLSTHHLVLCIPLESDSYVFVANFMVGHTSLVTELHFIQYCYSLMNNPILYYHM